MYNADHGTRSNVSIRQHLLSICHEMVADNKLINLDKLYKIARRELSVDSQAILDSIKALEDDMVIRADSKLLRSQLLENPTRREIYSIIYRDPGINFNQIRNRMGKGTKILLWHVEVLLDFGCIFSISSYSNKVSYYTWHLKEEEWPDEALFMLQLYQETTTKKILDFLSTGGSYASKEIASRLDISRQAVEYQLKKLIDQGIANFVQENVKKYFLIQSQLKLFLRCKEYHMVVKD